MAEAEKIAVLDWVTRFYIESHDFNGIPVRILQGVFADDVLRGVLAELVDEDLVSVVFGNAHPNPHIRALEDIPKEKQTELLSSELLEHACVYPLPKQLEPVVDRSKYEGRPYELLLALGTPQLAFRAFDLSVLEHYRNDPRYHYETDDIHGRLSVRDEYYGSGAMAERDEVLLQTFGFCYDDEMNRAVAVYVRYLADLSPEHQQIWKPKELSGSHKLHPDYFRTTILGDWGTKVSIFAAFIEELRVINRMVRAIGRPPLFREDFTEKPVPVGFSFLVRPTLSEYNRFVQLLDRLLSDNICRDFFQKEVEYEQEERRADGKIVVRPKGTIAILDEWIRGHFTTSEWQPIDEAIKTMKDIRRQRQRPAHAIDEDVFNQEYFREQRNLVIRAYEALRTLRLVLANFPGASDAEVPRYLIDAEIRTF